MGELAVFGGGGGGVGFCKVLGVGFVSKTKPCNTACFRVSVRTNHLSIIDVPFFFQL